MEPLREGSGGTGDGGGGERKESATEKEMERDTTEGEKETGRDLCRRKTQPAGPVSTPSVCNQGRLPAG